jgi:hypothetical protein
MSHPSAEEVATDFFSQGADRRGGVTRNESTPCRNQDEGKGFFGPPPPAIWDGRNGLPVEEEFKKG